MPLMNRLRELRARDGLSQGELGQLAGVSRQTISLIERGDYSPSVTLAIKLSAILKTTVEELFSYISEGEENHE
ncbi:MAG: helix-turn-helix transcriptional regulator [Angelakisella sp.]